jgi:hypothetical protein
VIEAAKSSVASSAASPPALGVQAVAEIPLDQPVTTRVNGFGNVVSRQIQQTNQQPEQPNQQDGESSARPNRDFSQSYYEARAQSNERRVTVDRTETDYFRLRAIGVDPNKVRKRSYDSSDEEDAQKFDNKRARTSSSSTGQQAPVDFRKSLPAPITDEERIARFRAIKASMSKQGHTPSRSFDFNSTRMSTFNVSTTSQVIQRARELLAQGSPSRQSTPDLSTPLPSDKPAYWGRQSRFVPQHLYGQPEAIRAYRAQVGGRSPASSQASPDMQSLSQSQVKLLPELPGFLSSPIPTRQSSYPTQQPQPFEAEEVIAVEDDADEEDEGDAESAFDEYLEEDEQDEDIEEGEEYYSEDEEEDDEGGYSDTADDADVQFTQKPGNTEDDAIELSD